MSYFRLLHFYATSDMTRIILFFIVVLLSASSFAESQYRIDPPEGSVPRGETVAKPLNGSPGDDPIDEIEIKILFDARILDFKSAVGGADYAIKDAELPVEQIFAKDELDTLIVRSTNVGDSPGETICMLNMEGLAFFDSVSVMIPIELKINGVPIEDAEFSESEIVVSGIPVFPDFPERIGRNYPNPFYDETRFPFNIENESTVEFKIFSSDGIRFYASGGDPEVFRIFLKTDAGEIEKGLNDRLEKGAYVLLFRPRSNDLASGAYLISMKTEGGIHTRAFLHAR